MIPKLEEEKAKASDEAAKANIIAASATKKETEVIAMKADIETKLAAAEPALIAASAALDSLNVKDLGELKSLKKPPAGVDFVTSACICLLQTKDVPLKKLDLSWKAAQQSACRVSMLRPHPSAHDILQPLKPPLPVVPAICTSSSIHPQLQYRCAWQ